MLPPAEPEYMRAQPCFTKHYIFKYLCCSSPSSAHCSKHSSVDIGCVPIQSIRACYACFSMQFEVADITGLHEALSRKYTQDVYSFLADFESTWLVDFVYSYIPQCFVGYKIHCLSQILSLSYMRCGSGGRASN